LLLHGILEEAEILAAPPINTYQVVPTPSTVQELKVNFPLQRNFWKYARLCEEDFQKIADTGDVILFKTPEFAS
jgi:hypothetical protein